MTKTAKQILLEMSEFDIRKHPEHLDQALKELEAIMRTLVIDYDNPLLVGHLSNDRKLEREFLRAEQRQALHTALYGEEK